ncbi:MAG: carbohydrate kinase family protein [Clostridia bacterium]|nr:carbohydrate kinase family protein [Clostridia bacterium]
MTNKTGIAVAGTVLVDKINQISAYPASGELTKILSVSRAVGGAVPNVGIDIKRVDPTIPVKVVGKIGNDGDGDFLVKTLKENEVDTSLLVRGGLPTSFTDVMSIVGGQRTFFSFPGACADFGFDDVDFENLDVKMLHLGYFLLLDKVDGGDGERILKRAKEMGIKTSIDLVSENSDRYHIVKSCLKYVDNVIINELEAGMIAEIEPKRENLEKIARAIKDMGVSERIIIHMPEICVCLSDNGFFEFPSWDLPNGFIKGKTGAGDAFCAGALIGIYRELDEMGILTLASKAATASLSAPDSIGGMMSEDEIDKLLKEMSIIF